MQELDLIQYIKGSLLGAEVVCDKSDAKTAYYYLQGRLEFILNVGKEEKNED